MPVISDTIAGKYFVGCHKAGNGNFGSAALIIREWVDYELKILLENYPQAKLISYHDETTYTKPPSNFPQCYPAPILGTVPSFHVSTKTKLVPLPHIDRFEQSTAPAVLDVVKLGDHWVSPYYKNRFKMPIITPLYPKVKDLTPLVSGLVNPPLRHEASDLKMWQREMTFEEALYGIPGTNFSAVDLSTSVGYPYVLTGKTTKRAWVEEPNLFAKLRRDYDAAIAQLRRGERPSFLVMDCLKDERLKLAKVKEAKTRVICAGSFVALLAYRTFFGGFCTWIQDNMIENGCTIGMNVYSHEFDFMVRELVRPNFKLFSGDSEVFDMTQHPQHLRSLFAAVNDWYSDSNGSIRDILSLDFMFARHITCPTHVGEEARVDLLKEPVPQDPFVVSQYLKIVNASDCHLICWVYECNSGHPSGSYLTAVINTLYSITKPFIVLQHKMADFKAVLEIARTKQVVPMGMGDDFVHSVAAALQHLLNALTFVQFSRSYGMNITRENKEPILEPFPADPPVFLKRLFRMDKEIGRWVGALEIPAIIDALCWMRKKNPSQLELVQLFDSQLLEFSYWGRKIYGEWAPRIQEAARATLNRPYLAPTWREALANASNLEADFRP
jgi:hypothetical protein